MDKPHKSLDAWKLAMELVERIYPMTATFPSEERYSLTDQMRRAAVSVPCNVAEGAARQTRKEFINLMGKVDKTLSGLIRQQRALIGKR